MRRRNQLLLIFKLVKWPDLLVLFNPHHHHSFALHPHRFLIIWKKSDWAFNIGCGRPVSSTLFYYLSLIDEHLMQLHNLIATFLYSVHEILITWLLLLHSVDLGELLTNLIYLRILARNQKTYLSLTSIWVVQSKSFTDSGDLVLWTVIID